MVDGRQGLLESTPKEMKNQSILLGDTRGWPVTMQLLCKEMCQLHASADQGSASKGALTLHH